MAHANLHMALGMGLATVATVVPVARAWRSHEAVAGPIARMLTWAYVLGVWALVPNLLTSAGAPAAIHRVWWSNVFVFHPIVDRLEEGGLLVGELALVGLLVFQYSLLVIAIVRARRRRRSKLPVADQSSG